MECIFVPGGYVLINIFLPDHLEITEANKRWLLKIFVPLVAARCVSME